MTTKDKKPDLKAVPGGKAKDKAKGGGKKGGEDAAQLKAKELAKRAADGDKDALGALEKIVVSFERWKKALGDQKEVARKAKEMEGAADATFENAIEHPLPTHVDHLAILAKLSEVESAYQEQKDATAEATEMRSSAADKVKAAAGKLERATQDGAQMTIPGTGE